MPTMHYIVVKAYNLDWNDFPDEVMEVEHPSISCQRFHLRNKIQHMCAGVEVTKKEITNKEADYLLP